jgi:WhiB family transcriptional regulator, redox-sensing transcriptional regulator
MTWHTHAACRGVHTNVSYEPNPKPKDDSWAEPARAICSTCPVRAECVREALDRDEKHGVWGGTTNAERRQLAKGRRSA